MKLCNDGLTDFVDNLSHCAEAKSPCIVHLREVDASCKVPKCQTQLQVKRQGLAPVGVLLLESGSQSTFQIMELVWVDTHEAIEALSVIFLQLSHEVVVAALLLCQLIYRVDPPAPLTPCFSS